MVLNWSVLGRLLTQKDLNLISRTYINKKFYRAGEMSQHILHLEKTQVWFPVSHTGSPHSPSLWLQRSDTPGFYGYQTYMLPAPYIYTRN